MGFRSEKLRIWEPEVFVVSGSSNGIMGSPATPPMFPLNPLCEACLSLHNLIYGEGGSRRTHDSRHFLLLAGA